ncbi:hypothetical protein WV31_10240 [Magnetospirillum sp. ME-1]|uniref:PDZ domain-containing protein n=1 Tax=Magnetospirillum sp. ME-1 TaxID=1639348 RepID=UPI000A179824|nr:PDZ domain-containing protein [Magnetospirillum sp. ME-1]ARJ66005.1 hypothetical protein WV31_10240 [Magnetospirillum sp. ME-1]
MSIAAEREQAVDRPLQEIEGDICIAVSRLARRTGVVIGAIHPRSVAFECGLRLYDRIVEVDGIQLGSDMKANCFMVFPGNWWVETAGLFGGGSKGPGRRLPVGTPMSFLVERDGAFLSFVVPVMPVGEVGHGNWLDFPDCMRG